MKYMKNYTNKTFIKSLRQSSIYKGVHIKYMTVLKNTMYYSMLPYIDINQGNYSCFLWIFIVPFESMKSSFECIKILF